MINILRNIENKCILNKLVSLPKTGYKFSTEIVRKETTDEIIIKGKSVQKAPFMKELFLGNFNKDLLTYPEILSEKQLADLNYRENNLKDIFSVESTFKNKTLTNETLNQLKLSGLFGSIIPEEFQGLGMTNTEFCKLNEHIGSTASILKCQQLYGIYALLKYGTNEQKEKYLPKIAQGEIYLSFCLNEPEGGTEPDTIQSTGLLENDNDWFISGTKSWITNGQNADLFLVFVNSKPNRMKEKEISCFIIEKSFGEITYSKPLNIIGNKGSSIVNVHFKDVKVPHDNILGNVGQGFEIALEILNKYRMFQAIPFLGTFKNLIREASVYSINKNRYLQTLKNNKIIQKKLVDASINAYILESMIYLTTGLLDEYENPDCDIESAIVKVYALSRCLRSSYDIFEIFNEDSLYENNDYYQLINDLRTPFLLEGNQDILYSFISLMGLRYAGQKKNDKIIKRRNPLMNPGFIIKNYLNSKNIYEINKYKDLEQYLHPSLQFSAKQLEQATAILAYTVEHVLVEYGSEIHHEHIITKRIANLAIEIYAMTAVLSRASRSYCIGLQNADSEINTAISCCHSMLEKINVDIEFIKDGLQSTDVLHYGKLAKQLFKNFNYFYEHPLKRNY